MASNRNTGIKNPGKPQHGKRPALYAGRQGGIPIQAAAHDRQLERKLAHLPGAKKCRRGRSCACAQLFCLRKPRPPVSDQEWAPVAAELQHALKQRLNEPER